MNVQGVIKEYPIPQKGKREQVNVEIISPDLQTKQFTFYLFCQFSPTDLKNCWKKGLKERKLVMEGGYFLNTLYNLYRG